MNAHQPLRRADRQAAEQRGRRAETIAALWLRAKGYRIVARRYRGPAGEIDLIVRRGRLLAAVEVKARATHSAAAAALEARQHQRIAATLSHFLVVHSAHADCNLRFDAVLVTPRRLPHHIVDIWRPDA